MNNNESNIIGPVHITAQWKFKG